MPGGQSTIAPQDAKPRKQPVVNLRRLFRWFRIAALLLVLGVAGFLFYWNQTGLPGFVKQAILEQLRARGLELAFEQIRFHWDRGIVAEKARLARSHLISGPELSFEEVQVGISPAALFKGRLEVDRLQIGGGRLGWRFAGGQEPAVPLHFENLEAALFFREQGLWELKSFSTRVHGLQFHLNGRLTNAVFLRELWKGQGSNDLATASSHPARLQVNDAMLRRFAETLARWNFVGQPEIRLEFHADATNLLAARLRLDMRADEADTPLGRFEHFRLGARSGAAAASRPSPEFAVTLAAKRAHTRLGDAADLKIAAQIPALLDLGWPSNFSAQVSCEHARTKWGSAQNLELNWTSEPGTTNIDLSALRLDSPWGRLAHPTFGLKLAPCHTNAARTLCSARLNGRNLQTGSGWSGERLRAEASWLTGDPSWEPRDLTATVWVERAETPQGTVADARLQLIALPQPGWRAALSQTNLPVWERLAKLPAHLTARLREVRHPQLDLAEADFEADWKPPWLSLQHFSASLGDGRMELAGGLQTTSGQLELRVTTDFDPRRIAHLLPKSAGETLAYCSWQKPPQFQGRLRVRLPAWTNRDPDWTKELASTLAIDGRVRLDATAYRQFRIDKTDSSFAYSNRIWRLEGLAVDRGKERIDLNLSVNERTRDFQVDGSLLVNPDSLGPLFPTNTLEKTGLLRFSEPVWIQASLTGNLARLADCRAEGWLRATNFGWRGIAIERLEAQAAYADRVLTVTHPRIQRREEWAEADLVIADFNRQFVYLTNATGRVAPPAVARCIGDHLVETLGPYKFAQPVKAQVEGAIPMHGEQGARVRFQVTGGPFNWWRFNAAAVTGTVQWIDRTVAVTNLSADLYEGRLMGNLVADFAQPRLTLLRFEADASEIKFESLMRDISDSTNKVEGSLSGRLVVTRAVAEDWKSWNGYGNVNLRDGLIWDMPVFGIFSPPLNKISAGLGNTRAREGSATFTIDNSVIRSEDLEIQASAYALKYRGTVDFDYRLDALVEAEILRDTWMVGNVVNAVLKPFTKLFEYKVTGTLTQPDTKPVYIPRFLFRILNPIGSLKQLFNRDREKPARGQDDGKGQKPETESPP